MGMASARKLREIVANAEHLLAIEYLCAAQAREFNPDFLPGRGALAAYELLRTRVKPLERDRYLAADIEATRELLCSGALLRAVEEVVGPLEA